MIDKYDETIEILFSGCMIKYTIEFNEIKPSIYGRGSDAIDVILEYEGELSYIPTGNACFMKCLKIFYK